MSIVKRFTLAVLVTTAWAGASPVAAREYHIASGRLLQLDASARRIVIRTGQGSQAQYSFNGDTRVVGAADDIADLTALSHITVHYAQESMELVATVIEVHGQPF